MLVFTMTTEVLIEFYERCKIKKAITEADKVNVLLGMASEGLLDGVAQTSRTKEQYRKDLEKEFNVVDVRELRDEYEEESKGD